MSLNPVPSNNNTSFSNLPLHDALKKNLISLNYETLTPIQEQSLPLMLNKMDVIAQAKTGSGKTAAFGLSILQHLKIELYCVQALILCPTRELAEQVSQSLRKLARLIPNVKILNLSGGMPLRPQCNSLEHGAHIIVGTPGRIQKHLDKASLSLDKLTCLVLDEADRMLDMGFLNDIKSIIHTCPKNRQTLLFSATFSEDIKMLSKQFMRSAQEIKIESAHNPVDMKQYFYETRNAKEKFALLKSLLLHYKPHSTLIFCNTKQQSEDVVNMLIEEGFSAICLNGDMEQSDRDLALIKFANHSVSILVATDLAARGLDIKELAAVISFDLAFQLETHIHRIGRTGRAGQQGLALSITTTADAERLSLIEKHLNSPIPWANADHLDLSDTNIPSPDMITLYLSMGKKDKIRPGDILGSLTKDGGFKSDKIGKINITLSNAYVAVHKSIADQAYRYLQNGKLKGRKVHVKKMQD